MSDIDGGCLKRKPWLISAELSEVKDKNDGVGTLNNPCMKTDRNRNVGPSSIDPFFQLKDRIRLGIRMGEFLTKLLPTVCLMKSSQGGSGTSCR